jgi:polysaccharide biosynthesis/export protein
MKMKIQIFQGVLNMSRNKSMTGLNTRFYCLIIFALVLAGCARNPVSTDTADTGVSDYVYTIAPGDRLDIFVWRNPDVSVSSTPVLPDGRISTPLVEEMMASGKTTVQLARDLEQVLSKVIADPYVTVSVVNIVGGYTQQIRVVGEAATPSAIPYKNDMTLLDVIIAVGGLTEFAAGNKASIVRTVAGKQTQYNVRLEDLLKRGDLSANRRVLPGDILIIPESLF